MAAIDFPNAPTIGQIFAGPNGQEYQWNGVAWLVAGEEQFVAKAGDTMTGPLVVPKVQFDANYFLELAGGINPVVNLDNADYIAYNRATNQLAVFIAGQLVLTLEPGLMALSLTGALKMPVGTTAERPVAPLTGQLRFNTTLAKFEGYNGTAWSSVTTGSATAGVTIGSTPPATPLAGDLWWESDTGIMFIWYDDGSTAQWVSASPAGVSLSALTALEARIAALEAA